MNAASLMVNIYFQALVYAMSGELKTITILTTHILYIDICIHQYTCIYNRFSICLFLVYVCVFKSQLHFRTFQKSDQREQSDTHKKPKLVGHTHTSIEYIYIYLYFGCRSRCVDDGRRTEGKRKRRVLCTRSC